MEVHKVLTEEEIDALLIERHGPENHRKMKHAHAARSEERRVGKECRL